MRVLMLFSRCGSADGFVVRYFKEGECYDLADGLARHFIRSRWAVECGCELPNRDAALPVVSPFSFRF